MAQPISRTRERDDYLQPAAESGWRRRAFDIVFGDDTRIARAFDAAVIVAIVTSVVVTMLDSVAAIDARCGPALRAAEWVFTILFGAEYVLRLAVLKRPMRYARSFYGLVDLIAVLPALVSLMLTGSEQLIGIRALRILRVFRVLKLVRYVGAAEQMREALVRSRRKIFVFITTMLVLISVFGSIMYLVEGPEHGFTSIPRAMYWATVTMATVGFGDLTPSTALGQFITSVMILIGYGIIAVPTGIYAAELSNTLAQARAQRACNACGTRGHDADAQFCRLCGGALDADTN
ncbi:ion transporter [Dokdonella sp.]|uniref:ion transporter n=1 Tax=Dokdonella sp. TaxID=2291710 RepID=UPI00261412CE|nr:ion transporter [Dokdonella sp.]